MIHTVVLARGLDAHHIPDILDNADGIVVPAHIPADGTFPFVRNHHAGTAIDHLLPKSPYGIGEMPDILHRLAEKMECKPERTLLSHSRQ